MLFPTIVYQTSLSLLISCLVPFLTFSTLSPAWTCPSLLQKNAARPQLLKLSLEVVVLIVMSCILPLCISCNVYNRSPESGTGARAATMITIQLNIHQIIPNLGWESTLYCYSKLLRGLSPWTTHFLNWRIFQEDTSVSQGFGSASVAWMSPSTCGHVSLELVSKHKPRRVHCCWDSILFSWVY
jgi:hypothetical protein